MSAAWGGVPPHLLQPHGMSLDTQRWEGKLGGLPGLCEYSASSSRWRCHTCSFDDYLFNSSHLLLALVYEVMCEMASSRPSFNLQKWQFYKFQYILHKEIRK